MDVTAPRQTAAVPPVPGHIGSTTAAHTAMPPSVTVSSVPPADHVRAPEAITEPRPAPPDTTELPISIGAAKQVTADKIPFLEQIAEQPAPTKTHENDHKPLPIGAIVGAICLMIGLSAVAILIYLQSQ